MKMPENQKNYVPLIIPIDKPFEKLSNQEAQEYFDWFISHVDERALYLRHKVAKSLQIKLESLDFSLESLTLIWKWFLQVAELSKTPKKVLDEMEKSLKGHEQSFIDDMINESKEELSAFTKYVIRDISMYVGKMFTKNHIAVTWGYHIDIEKDSFANMPQLVGFVDTKYNPPFEMEFEPIFMTEGQAANLFNHTQNENDLYNICKKWIQWIPKNEAESTY